jgi:hypothetical protein
MKTLVVADQMQPASWPDAVTAIATAVIAAASIIAAFAWSAEIRGRARFEAARQFRRVTLKFRDFFLHSRSRSTVAKLEKEEDRFSQVDVNAALIRSHEGRLERVAKVMEEVEDAADDARVFWREKVDDLVNELRSVNRELRDDMLEHMDLLKSLHPATPDDLEGLFAPPQDDKLGQRCRAAVQAVLDWSRPLVIERPWYRPW